MSRATASSLAEKWSLLREKRLSHGEPRLRVPTSPVSDVFAALRLPEDHAKLLIGLGPGTATFRSFDSDAIVARAQQIDGHAFASIELVEPAHEDLFDALCTDLVQRIDGREPAETKDIVVTRLERWRDMLRSRRRGLTIQRQRGLVAELETLGILIGAGLPAVQALDAWEGPGGGLHDFVLDRLAIEVKGPSSADEALRIHGIAQLFPPDGADRLVLTVCRVEEHAEGRDLGEVVDHARTLVTGSEAAVRLMERCLLLAGWDDEDRERYGRPWRVSAVTHHEVVDGFPRIEPPAVPDGVWVSAYSVSQKAAAAYLLSAEDLEMYIGGTET